MDTYLYTAAAMYEFLLDIRVVVANTLQQVITINFSVVVMMTCMTPASWHPVGKIIFGSHYWRESALLFLELPTNSEAWTIF